MKAETYISFILDQLRSGETKAETICADFCTRFQLSERSFWNYWKQASERHKQTATALQRAKQAKYTEHQIEALKQGLLDLDQRKMILAEIAVGKTERQINGKTSLPTDSERIKAIAELNRIDGDYAPTQSEIKGTETLPFKIIHLGGGTPPEKN